MLKIKTEFSDVIKENITDSFKWCMQQEYVYGVELLLRFLTNDDLLNYSLKALLVMEKLEEGQYKSSIRYMCNLLKASANSKNKLYQKLL